MSDLCWVPCVPTIGGEGIRAPVMWFGGLPVAVSAGNMVLGVPGTMCAGAVVRGVLVTVSAVDVGGGLPGTVSAGHFLASTARAGVWP